MSGKRIKDPTLTEQTSFVPTLKVLVDKPDTGSNDWLLARAMELSLLGNTYMQGSSNGVNWHDEVLSTDTFYQFSTDGGVTWTLLDTDHIRENNNLYYTEDRVSANTDVTANTDARHTHDNKDIIDNIIDTGSGINFLADDGTYKNVSALSSPSITVQTLTYNATNTTMDYDNGSIGQLTLTGDVTTLTLSNLGNGEEGAIEVVQDSTGGYGIANLAHSGLTVRYAEGQHPTVGNISGLAYGRSLISFIRVGSYLYVSFGRYYL